MDPPERSCLGGDCLMSTADWACMVCSTSVASAGGYSMLEAMARLRSAVPIHEVAVVSVVVDLDDHVGAHPVAALGQLVFDRGR